MSRCLAPITSLCLLVGCSQAPPAEAIRRTTAASQEAPQSATADSVAALATPQRFLRWYAPRMDSLQAICMIPAYCNSDAADRYVVDFKRVEGYLSVLNSKAFLSSAYLKGRRADYHRWQDTLQAHPQFEGAVLGFDSDPIILSQDSDEMPELLKLRPRLLSFSKDSAHVGLLQKINSRWLVFHLSRTGKKWLIDDITPIFLP